MLRNKELHIVIFSSNRAQGYVLINTQGCSSGVGFGKPPCWLCLPTLLSSFSSSSVAPQSPNPPQLSKTHLGLIASPYHILFNCPKSPQPHLFLPFCLTSTLPMCSAFFFLLCLVSLQIT
ncbi:Hypothetical predicted protein [Podarcis lilfordi]|uniref:Uncharacterized protein n=1 Tax=Podarcis lilfordi TaxID=74358 RepID=A0AA35LDC7_9SAUR|nr:Hypothetical predicted protein [Podarcis lilfordi]